MVSETLDLGTRRPPRTARARLRHATPGLPHPPGETTPQVSDYVPVAPGAGRRLRRRGAGGGGGHHHRDENPDDRGRAGRWIAADRCGGVSAPHGPWPGRYYTLPLAVAVALGLLVAARTLRRIVRRPRPGVLAEAALDDRARRGSAVAVVAARGVAVSPPAAVSLIGTLGLRAVGDLRPCARAGWPLLRGTTFAGASLLVTFLVVVVASSTSVVSAAEGPSAATGA